MNAKRTSICAAAIMVISAYVSLGWAENIDSDNNGSQYVWSENAGWFNFEPGEEPGVHVSETALTGYAWAANIGWINLSPMAYGGVFNDGAGNLSGYAW
ncbi:MAG: hypothetical protein JW709_00130, partial [Sedimentisphaerales bacterium]|nr:hypothetical protein [Sedimentisphaerales bacterium]